MNNIYIKIRENLSPIELKWIDTIANWKKSDEAISERKIILKLHNELPEDFELHTMFHKLFADIQERSVLSPLGHFASTGKTSELYKVDKIIKYFQEKLLSNPEITEFKSDEIHNKLKISNSSFYVQQVFHLTGIFNKMSKDSEGACTLSAEPFKSYLRLLKYSGIEDLIELSVKWLGFRTESTDLYQPNFESTQEVNSWSVFKSVVKSIDPKLVFVLMPFTTNWADDVYNKLIVEPINSLGLQCLRADSLSGSIILDDIWIKINQAGLIIADVTGQNPNVMYELGIAHALDKKVVILSQEIEKSPFDLKHLRHLEYKVEISSTEKYAPKLKEQVSRIYQELYPEVLLRK